MIENVAKALYDIEHGERTYHECINNANASIRALKENDPNSFISEIINKYAGLHPMDEHGRKLWNNLIDVVLNMKEKA